MSDTGIVVEIPEEDLKEVEFNHKSVRAYIGGTKWYMDPNVEGRAAALIVDYFIRGDQPDHPELEGQYEGMKIGAFLWLGAGKAKFYKSFCRAFGLDLRKPDLAKLENVPVIIALKTNGEYINVNQATPE